MNMPELIDVIPVQNELGEGVIWDAIQGAVWWTDIEKSTIYRYELAKQSLQKWRTPERLGCFALVKDNDYLIAGFESGFAYFNPETNYIEWLHKVEQDTPHTRLNDGRVDRQGRFWAGSMAEGGSESIGSLYCFDEQLQCDAKISGIAISNSLCWSPDSKYLYFTDTPTERIDRYDFNPQTAALSNRSTFATTEAGISPDGSTIDADGYLWNAQWGGSQVVRYTPDGQVDLVLPIPTIQPTCVAFGGPDLNLLFVTSATQGLDQETLAKEPDAGNLFIYKSDFTGIADKQFVPAK